MNLKGKQLNRIERCSNNKGMAEFGLIGFTCQLAHLKSVNNNNEINYM